MPGESARVPNMLMLVGAFEVIARSCFVGTEEDPSALAADVPQEFGYK